MGFMAMDYFRQSPLLAMPVLALVIFILVFLAVTLRAMLTSSSRWDELAQLPLQDAPPASLAQENGHE
ncbi:MAG: hypothetical protein JWN04_4075 [Myxococcaceae bacterium]|nr:hypothetical protein [Myxococcaceae bacterium]